MSDTRSTGALPPDAEVQVRAYLAAFLSAEAVDDAVAEVAADSGFWGDTDDTEILAVAHAVLTSRLRVTTDVEVLVLNEDVGLSVPEIAAVLALPPPEVRRVLDDALAVLAEVEDDRPVRAPAHAPAVPAGVPRGAAVPAAPPRRRHRLLLVAATLVVAVIALLAAWGLGRGDGCPVSAGICISDAVLTDAVDPSTGAPGADRTAFGLDDPVTLWFTFERRNAVPGPLEVRWYREGTLLYATDVRLGSGDRLNVSLAGLWSDQPGRYRVEVADRDQLLLERDFRIGG